MRLRIIFLGEGRRREGRREKRRKDRGEEGKGKGGWGRRVEGEKEGRRDHTHIKETTSKMPILPYLSP